MLQSGCTAFQKPRKSKKETSKNHLLEVIFHSLKIQKSNKKRLYCSTEINVS